MLAPALGIGRDQNRIGFAEAEIGKVPEPHALGDALADTPEFRFRR